MTAAELAEDLNVSKVTIYNHLKKIDKRKYTKKYQNVTYITEEGQQIIKDSLYRPIQSNVSSERISINDSPIPIKGEQLQQGNPTIEILKEQIREKDNQIKELHKLLDQQQQLTLQSQKQLEETKKVLELQEPEIKNIELLQKELNHERNKTFIQRIRSLFK